MARFKEVIQDHSIKIPACGARLTLHGTVLELI